jgi:hypothetical protein
MKSFWVRAEKRVRNAVSDTCDRARADMSGFEKDNQALTRIDFH